MNGNKEILNKLTKLERQVSGIESEITQLASIQEEFKSSNVSPIDKVWQCDKCGGRLGIYDQKTDELRVRYRDFFAYWKAGKGGYLKMVCRSCSHINELQYEE
jgi:hypothetical protein